MRYEGQTMGRHGNIAGVMLVALMLGGSAGGADSVDGANTDEMLVHLRSALDRTRAERF